jgi:DHA2 family multidrug resistance protein
MGIILGPTFGPTLGGYIIDNYDWPLIFFVNVPIGIVATVMAFTFIRDIKYNVVKQTLDQVDWLGIGLLILGIGCLQMVLEQGEREEWFQSRLIVMGTLGAAVGVIGFIWRELTYKYPIVNLRILRNPNTAFGTFLTFILGFGLFAMVFTIPVFTQGTLGYTAMQTGMLFIPGALLTGFSMPIMGRLLSQGVQPKILTLLGFVFTLIFLVWMMNLLTPGTSDGDMFYPLLFRGLGLGMSMVPLMTYTMAGLSGAEIPQSTGFTSMMRQLGGAFGVAVVSSYVTNRIQVHRADLVQNITANNPLATERLNFLSRNFASRGASFDLAQLQAYKAIEGMVMKQSALLAFKDVFQFVAFFFLACVPLILFMRGNKGVKAPVVTDAH